MVGINSIMLGELDQIEVFISYSSIHSYVHEEAESLCI